MDGDVVETEPVMEGIRPELGGKSSTAKHGADGIADRLMRTFAGAVLMGRRARSTFDSVPSLLKQSNDLVAMAEVTTEVETNVFVGNFGTQGVEGEPTVEEVDRGGLVAEDLAV
jgi:hypothetical protein